MMNFKYYRNKFKEESFDMKDMYILTCDMEQKKFRELGNTGIKIEMKHTYSLDHRGIHPNIGTIVYSSEGSQFKEGTELMCKHFTFEDSNFESQHFFDDGQKLFMVDNYQIMFGIVNGELVPREGVLLCKGVEGKFIDTDLELGVEYYGRRRDIAEVVKVWDGCEEFKVGDYVMLQLGGDYEFEWNGEKYIKVDTSYGDAFAVTDSPDWYDSVINKHVKHNKSTENIIKERNG